MEDYGWFLVSLAAYIIGQTVAVGGEPVDCELRLRAAYGAISLIAVVYYVYTLVIGWLLCGSAPNGAFASITNLAAGIMLAVVSRPCIHNTAYGYTGSGIHFFAFAVVTARRIYRCIH